LGIYIFLSVGNENVMQISCYTIGNSTWAQYALQLISASSTRNCISWYSLVVYPSSF